MRTEVFYAGTIDKATTDVLEVLKEKANTTRSASTRDNVFYFDGWDGLGASSVLRAIAQRLTPTSLAGRRALAEWGFDQVIHIDCSMWESRRALQRAVAEQLGLHDKAMEMFDRQDEEDDFRGLAQGSRDEVQQVVREMQRLIQKMDRRFLVIFHNGSGEEIDLASCCGFPLSGFSTSKMLWTFQGRFRLCPRTKVDRAMASAGTTDVFISGDSQVEWAFWSYLMHQEASEVLAAYKSNVGPHCIIDQPAQVAECFLYMLELCYSGRHSMDYDLATHGAANFWTCDGIMQQLQQKEGRDIDAVADDDSLWRAAIALQREMQLDVDYHHQHLPSHLTRFAERKPYWTSPTYGIILVPSGARPNGNMFGHYVDKLRVLKLSRCTFNFQSPPFLWCQGLRFLWLDHCKDAGIKMEGAGKEDVRRFFEKLWVLDVRYTHCDHILSSEMMDLMTQLRELHVMGVKNWDMGQLQGRLPSIRKLQIKNSRVSCSCSENDLFSEMNRMELLDFSGNSEAYPRLCLSGPGAISNNSCLETVIVDDWSYGLERVSFRVCTKLKNLVLRGLMTLRTLNMSGTAVKTLDLTETLLRYLDELCLLDCKNLCAILWPPKDAMERDLAKLYIDTTQPAVPTYQSRAEKANKRGTTATSRSTIEFPWYISIWDARLLASLEAVFSDSRGIYLDVSSPASPTIAAGGCTDEGIKSSGTSAPAVYKEDTIVDHLQQATEGDGDDALGIMSLWPCPDVPDLSEKNCYMHIQDQARTKSQRGGEETSTVVVPEFVIDSAKILHVHDSLSITSITSATMLKGKEWHALEWCRIERCPKLVYVFTSGISSERLVSFAIYRLRTFWVSQVPKAKYIFVPLPAPQYHWRTFPGLTFLHVDRCTRLIHVIPLSRKVIYPDEPSFKQLETLEILWCGELREVFYLDTDARDYLEEQVPHAQPVTLYFPSLKRIHLHELPSLQHICGVRMSAPNLETVKIRGCWSLTRLPDVGDGDKAVECDCEKEWWDRLEWDYGSQATRYKPIHSQYYKKKMLRSTVLR